MKKQEKKLWSVDFLKRRLLYIKRLKMYKYIMKIK